RGRPVRTADTRCGPRSNYGPGPATNANKGEVMDDQTRAFLRDLFAPHPDAPPADVVPPSPLTLADLDEANQAAGVSATVTTPGAMTFDVDGIPTGFDPPTTNTVISG